MSLMFKLFSQLNSRKDWPYIIIFLITSVYFIYLLNDSRYFFYDDFTALKFVADRSYSEVILDSLISRNVDRHKFLGYLLHKLIYDTAGLEVNFYFLILFIQHTLNSFLVYWILNRVTKSPMLSLTLAGIFAYRFYLWWWSNSHIYLSSFFCLLSVAFWLKFLDTKRKFYLFLLTIIWPLGVFSYGPAILIAPSLIVFTFFLVNKPSLSTLKPLLPLVILMGVYLLAFTFTPDSLERFASSTNPYRSDFSLQTFLLVHTNYLYELSGHLLPNSTLTPIIFWPLLFILGFFTKSRYVFLLIAFFTAMAANSFFAAHTMFYYLYFAIVFILLFFALLLRTKLWLPTLILLIISFNPLHELRAVLFRLRHPATNFEKQAMRQIINSTNQALLQNQTSIKLSNWTVTPNLQHAIDNQVLPIFLTSPEKNRYEYIYSRDTQTLTLIPKQ